MSQRQISSVGLHLVEVSEGFRPAKYKDVAGYWTIGYGHYIKPWEKLEVVTEQEAQVILEADLNDAESSVLRLIRVPLQDGQFDALVDFTFNLGGGALQRSTLRSCLNRGEYSDAANELPKWCMAGGRKWKALFDRRVKERNLFLYGVLL